jgi:hypothetical protein
MIFGLRHGERGDRSDIEVNLVENMDDPHLTKVGL